MVGPEFFLEGWMSNIGGRGGGRVLGGCSHPAPPAPTPLVVRELKL